jgi:signal transduction histidine kinase
MWNKITPKPGTEMVMTISGLFIFITGILAITGWLTGIHVLASIYSNYIPMALSTALIIIVFGVLMFFNLFESKNQNIKTFILTIIVLITLSGLLHFLGFFIQRDLTFEQFLFSDGKKIGNFPINKMSHYGGLLFFISGIAVLLKYFGKDQKMTTNLIGNLGLFVSFAGFIASLGYIFGTPFLYSGNIIPLAFTSALSFVFLGLGILALAGDKHYMVRKLIGNQASARILRTFIPFLILENVIGDTLEQYISTHYNINEALISALVSLITIVIGILLILYLTKRIFQSADKAEAERLKAEEALKVYAGELELANNTKNKLFSIIAHDLRSPFNSILGLTNLLNDKRSNYSETDKKSIVVKLKESSENAFNLLENLLAWSMSQSEGIKVKPEKIDLYEIVSEQIYVLENIAITKNINIENQIEPGTFADADRNMITTVIRNLLNNALKFTQSGGVIILTAIENNDKIEVSFTDNGVGIPPNFLKDLFNSCETHSTKGTANEKGTGLGLMVCKEFIEINGGEIWVESKEGNGSTFTFTLPECVESEKMII